MNTCYDCEGNKKLPLKQRKAIGGTLLCKKHFARRRGRSPLRRRTVDTGQYDRLKPKKKEE